MRSLFLVPLAGIIAAASAQAATQAPATQSVWQLSNGDIVFRDYPERARVAGEQGRVGFFIKLDALGNPVRCQISRSSGYERLDQETCKLLLTHARFQRSGKDERRVVHNGVVNWTLATHSQTAAAMLAAEKAQVSVASASGGAKRPSPRWLGWNRTPKQDRNAAGEKLICKRLPRTDSIAGSEMRCRSAAGWAKSDESTGFWSDLQGRKGTGTGAR